MHNKGPWYVVRHYGGDGFEVCGRTPDGQAELATVHEQCEYVPSLPAEANARLMAAAPELLVAAVALLDLHGWEPGSEWGEEEREIFQRCMNLVGETTDALCGGKIGERKVIADQANEALRGARGAAPVLSGVSTREDLIYWLGCVDRNGVWTDEDMVSEGWDPMTLDEAWEQVELMLDKGGE
jgi:hypothetical protein